MASLNDCDELMVTRTRNKPTSWCIALLEKLTVSRLLKKLPPYMEPGSPL
jgi:hypothetical protein